MLLLKVQNLQQNISYISFQSVHKNPTRQTKFVSQKGWNNCTDELQSELWKTRKCIHTALDPIPYSPLNINKIHAKIL